MSQVEYQPTNCKNCGSYSHCGTSAYQEIKTELGRQAPYIIESCKHCRCDACSTQKNT